MFKADGKMFSYFINYFTRNSQHQLGGHVYSIKESLTMGFF
jgi:hypothetical protein